MDLRTLPIVLVFAGEMLAFETVQDLTNGLAWFGKHGFERYTWCKLANIPDL